MQTRRRRCMSRGPARRRRASAGFGGLLRGMAGAAKSVRGATRGSQEFIAQAQAPSARGWLLRVEVFSSRGVHTRSKISITRTLPAAGAESGSREREQKAVPADAPCGYTVALPRRSPKLRPGLLGRGLHRRGNQTRAAQGTCLLQSQSPDKICTQTASADPTLHAQMPMASMFPAPSPPLGPCRSTK